MTQSEDSPRCASSTAGPGLPPWTHGALGAHWTERPVWGGGTGYPSQTGHNYYQRNARAVFVPAAPPSSAARSDCKPTHPPPPPPEGGGGGGEAQSIPRTGRQLGGPYIFRAEQAGRYCPPAPPSPGFAGWPRSLGFTAQLVRVCPLLQIADRSLAGPIAPPPSSHTPEGGFSGQTRARYTRTLAPSAIGSPADLTRGPDIPPPPSSLVHLWYPGGRSEGFGIN